MHPNNLRRALNRLRPSSPPLDKLLHLRPQLSLSQREIIHGTSAQNRQSRKSCTAAIHESAAGLAEVVGHGRIGANGLLFAERREVILATGMFEV